MAYDDALFQLGMDLTRSSTAQKEEFGVAARVAHDAGDELYEHAPEDDEGFNESPLPVAGHHLIIDLMGAHRLDELDHIERTLRRCVDASGAHLLHVHLNRTVPGGGVSGVAVLRDSHISIYTRPRAGYAALDVFMPGDAVPERVIPILRLAFGARDVVTRTMRRGNDVSHSGEAAAPTATWTTPQRKSGQGNANGSAQSVRERLRKTA